jgi:foldase protein PrsA
MKAWRKMDFRTNNFYGIRITVVLLILLCILIIAVCDNETEIEILAKFNGGEVAQNEYLDHYLLSTQYKPDKFPSLDNLKEIVTLKAMEKLTVLEAYEMGLDKDTSYQEITEKNINRIIYHDYMRKNIIDAIVTDSLIHEFYSNYTPQHRLYYIMRPVLKSSTKEFELSQLDTINYVFSLLRKGQKFEDLAKKYSQDITTNQKGGDLGFLIRESMGDAKLRAVMDTLKSFSFSIPIQGYEGYYILYKGEQRDVPVPPFSSIKAKIWNTLFHTRRHLIRNLEKVHFEKYAQNYNYQVNKKVIDEILEKAGGKNVSELTLLNFDVLSEQDMNKIIATYNQGAIKVFEIFAKRNRAPDNIEGFEKKFNSVSQQHILACRAKDIGLHNTNEMLKKSEKMRHAMLRSIFTEKEIKEKVQANLDALIAEMGSEQKCIDLKDFKQKKRLELEKEYKSNIEVHLKNKYNFKFIEKNFAKAIEEARKKKKQQKMLRSKNEASVS